MALKLGFTAVILIIFYLEFSQSYCCKKVAYKHTGICRDGSDPGMVGWGCCAYGSCNIFCCNCAGGCKQGPHGPKRRNAREYLEAIRDALVGRKKRSVNELELIMDQFAMVDLDMDGLIDAKEAAAYLGGSFNATDFKELDMDKDGMLSLKEFDEDLGEDEMENDF